MAEVNMPIITASDYPPNSQASKKEELARPKLEKVTNVTVTKRKTPLGRKLADAFLGADIVDVKSYIIKDAIIPALKSAIIDGLGMLFFGTVISRYNSNQRVVTPTNYSYISTSNSQRGRQQTQPQPQKNARNQMSDIDGILFQTQADAENILSNMVDYIADYGEISVADFYDMVGIASESEFTDHYWGWTNLSQAYTRRVSGGYVIVFPKVVNLK